MKKIIVTILLITSFSIIAQESKPTKEQTVEFVTNYMKNLGIVKENDFLSSLGKNIKYFSYDSFEVVGHSLYVSIIIDEEYTSFETLQKTKKPRVSKSLIIDLSKVEKITTYTTLRDTSIGNKKTYSSDFMNYIVFHSVKGEKVFLEDGKYVKEVEIFINQDQNQEVKESQIFKAFEHLRKLCGGPEPPKPIKF